MTVRDLWQRLIAPIDPPLMTMAALLLTFALLVVSSASSERLGAQLMNMLVALVVMRLAAQVPPQRLMYFALPIFVGGLLLGGFYAAVTAGVNKILTLTAAVPSMDSAALSASKSMVTPISAAVRTGAELPPGITALSGAAPRIPPACV